MNQWCFLSGEQWTMSLAPHPPSHLSTDRLFGITKTIPLMEMYWMVIICDLIELWDGFVYASSDLVYGHKIFIFNLGFIELLRNSYDVFAYFKPFLKVARVEEVFIVKDKIRLTIWLISWLLIPLRRKEPGHQQLSSWNTTFSTPHWFFVHLIYTSAAWIIPIYRNTEVHATHIQEV